MRIRDAVFIVVAVCTVGWARDWRDMREEAGKGLPPRIQYYNRLKGEPKLVSFFPTLDEPESLNVRLVGKWGRGPAASVTGRDSLVYLGLGSEVAIFNVNNAHNPRILNEVQCRYVVDRVILKDTLLYCVLQGGIEVFNIANPLSVNRIKYLPITVVDMCIQDSLAYTISADSFKVYQIVAPDSFLRLGACADSGYYIAADSGFAYLCDRWGLYVIDATDPTNPHQATIMSPGVQTGEVLIDSGLCYYFEVYPSGSFVIASVADPYHPNELSRTPSIGFADMYKIDFYLYLSTYQIVDVTNPASPTVISSVQLPANQNSVWTRSPYTNSFVADDYEGLAIINITDPVHPALDTVMVGASDAYGVSIECGLACVADLYAGMKVLGVGNPARPVQVGEYDSIGQSPNAHSVALKDTYAYLMTTQWYLTDFRIIDVSDSANPRLAASCGVYNGGGTVILHDSLAFVAEDYKLEVFSVANPRNPRLVGSCGLPNSSYGLCLRDTLALVGNLTSLQVINIANPASPTVVGVLSMRGLGVAVQDSVALVGGLGKLYSVSIGSPHSPYLIDSLIQPGAYYGISIAGNTAFAGGGGTLRVIDIHDPTAMLCTGYHVAPDAVLRVCLRDSLIFAACEAGGICIFETTSTSAIAEASPVAPRPQAFALTPNPASSFVNIRLEVKQNTNARNAVRLYDAAGRVVLDIPFAPDRGKQSRLQRVDISTLPDGCYFVAVEPSGQGRVQKVVKTGRQ